MSKPSSDRWIGPLLMLVPGDIRQQFKGEMVAERLDMRERGWKPWRVNIVTAGMLLAGVAQHVPLSRIDANAALQPEMADRAAMVGWILWRMCGPLLFLGYALSSGWLALLGGIALIGTFGCIGAVVAKGREPYDNTEARLLNGVFGGVAAVLVTTMLAGVFFSLLLLLGLAVGSTGLGAFAVKALVFVILLFVGSMCVAGWVPREWEPARMVRH
ncbi:MAG: hypothetical protein ACYTHK_04845 [Planctomycetota bacterium]|jgi:hypothetical protein